MNVQKIILVSFLAGTIISNKILNAQEYMIGADFSLMKIAEDNGTVFKENGVAKPGMQIFREHGYNWTRLRVFNRPVEQPNTTEYALAQAKQAKALGMKIILSFHYSDDWTNPGKQDIPGEWAKMTHEQLVRAIFEYSRTTIISFRDAGLMPEIVSIGNEIQNGILWPDGKLPGNWKNFAQLMQAGINGVYAGCENIKRPDILIHIGEGGNRIKAKEFFDNYFDHGLNLDFIGVSYYPWWQGTLLDLRDNFFFMAEEYKKPIILFEVAYNYAPKEYKNKPAPFPETPEGQKEFLEEVNRIIMAAPDGFGAGIFWWEPAQKSGRSTRDFFDENGNVLPVINVFDRFTRH